MKNLIRDDYVPGQEQESPARIRDGRLAESPAPERPAKHSRRKSNRQPPELRSIAADKPYAWLSVAALKRIRDRVDQVPSALAVYLALGEIVNDPDNRKTQKCTVSETGIGLRCGLAVRTVSDRLGDLKKIGLVDFDRTKGKRQEKEYRLLTTNPSPPPDRQRLPN